ncbi:MAG: hypothetical protein WAN93_09750 [Solirubrobacteraceae bacterium]
MTDLPRDIEHELAALADGSLAPERREQALERVRGSSELQGALAEQRRAVQFTAAVDVRAPASLHRRVRALAPTRRKRSFATPRIGFAAVAAAAALVAVVIAIGFSGGSGSSGLSVQQTAALTLSQATMPAPAESKAHRAQLAAAVGGVSFPYWKERFGWRSSGARTDQLAGRSVTTIFYSSAGGGRVGYAIASGPAPAVRGGTVVQRWGVSYRVLSHDGATVVTWRRGGHLCVVSGYNVSARTLLSLASWGSEKPHAA